jgi:hexosaminidase
MKQFLVATALFFMYNLCFSQTKNIPHLIPEPVGITVNTGEYVLPKQISIVAANLEAVKYVSSYLQKKLTTATGYTASVTNTNSNNSIQLLLNTSPNTTIGKEGYTLSVTSSTVVIRSNEAAGLFYGVQTFLQLLPPAIESNEIIQNVQWTVPSVEITDYPRFGWRGLMLDVSRHFFTKEEVKQYIDQMARYKFNLFHFHLTDDEGWRLQIKSLPLLTEIGAWNVKKEGHFGDFTPPAPDEPRNYGGFYTHEDIKEIVQFAKERFVNILPEIEMPGHSLATIVSYPELSCTAGASQYKVRSGEKIIEWPANGHFYGLIDNTLCPANEKVYPFIDKIFTEVAQLFPFEYVHMGGDECIRNFWEKNDTILQLLKKKKLKNLDEVQSYFVKRVEKIVASKGKKLIGWDEILEGGLAPNAAVMSWRGMKGGIEAAKMGHEVVMSPTTYVYLDYMQSDAIMEPRVYASLRLNKVYEFEPLPEGIDAKFIKGAQGNLWTEQVYNFRQVQYMTWPRSFALIEAVWSPKEKKNWNTFVTKVENHFKRLDAAEIKYGPGLYDPIFKVSKNEKGQLVVTLSTELDNLSIHYSFDNSSPDSFYPKYTTPLLIPKDATQLRVITYRNKQAMGRMNNMPVEELKKRAK